MANRNIADIIEDYLKKILSNSEQVEISRSDVASLFNVVPSQINYVIKTRFTIRDGYLVQSKRGGGGYIRIEKMNILDNVGVIDTLISSIGDKLDFRTGKAIIQTLFNNELLTEKEAKLIIILISKQSLGIDDKKTEDKVRANITLSLLYRLKYET